MSDDPGIAWESLYCLRPYNSYKLMGTRNPAFSTDDGRLLDFKEGQQPAIDREASNIAAILAQLDLPPRMLVTVVPGHEAKPSNRETPLGKLAEKLAAGHKTLIARADTLIRHKTVSKLAAGGDRSVETHLHSIEIKQGLGVRGECVLVLDDIATTGHSMEAVRLLLKRAGANRIAGIAIGRTVKIF